MDTFNSRLVTQIGYANALKRKRLRAKFKPVKPSKLYLMVCNGLVKIGIATDPLSRLIELQVGNPYEITLLKVTEYPDAAFQEDLLHSRLDQYRIRGEWFNLPQDVLASLIK